MIELYISYIGVKYDSYYLLPIRTKQKMEKVNVIQLIVSPISPDFIPLIHTIPVSKMPEDIRDELVNHARKSWSRNMSEKTNKFVTGYIFSSEGSKYQTTLSLPGVARIGPHVPVVTNIVMQIYFSW